MVYEVRATVQPSMADEYSAWLRPHITELIGTGCFESATIERVLESLAEETVFVMRYTFENLKDFKRYEVDYAPNLRSAGSARFGESVQLTRSILEVLATESKLTDADAAQ